MKRLSVVVLFSMLAACGGSTTYLQKAQKTLAVTYETTQIAEKAFVSWDSAHQQQLVAESTSAEEAKTKLDAYRDKRQPVIKAFVVAYSSMAAVSAIFPLVEKGLKKETDLIPLLGDTLMAALEVKAAIDAIKEVSQ